MAGRLGLILGSGAAGGAAPEGAVALDRHGDPYTLPHLLDHEVNLRRLIDAGCDRVLGVASVGGLREELGPGTLVCPDDFIALDLSPLTTSTDAGAHRVPGFDSDWRARVARAVGEVADVRDGGVYWQVVGPRLETPAEVRFVAEHADVIGMTAAAECIVAGELGLPYAALCQVDNLANGVASEPLAAEQIVAGQAAHRAELDRVLERVLPALV